MYTLSKDQEKWLENSGNTSFECIAKGQSEKTQGDVKPMDEVEMEIYPKDGWEMEGTSKIKKSADRAIDNLGPGSNPSISADFEVLLSEDKPRKIFRGVVKVKCNEQYLFNFPVTSVLPDTVDHQALKLASVMRAKFGERLLEKLEYTNSQTDVLKVLSEEVQDLPESSTFAEVIGGILSGCTAERSFHDLNVMIQNINTGSGSIDIRGSQVAKQQTQLDSDYDAKIGVTAEHQSGSTKKKENPLDDLDIHFLVKKNLFV